MKKNKIFEIIMNNCEATNTGDVTNANKFVFCLSDIMNIVDEIFSFTQEKNQK